MNELHIIGAGMAGSEAAWQAAQRGVRVVLHEMRRGGTKTEAHHTQDCAELVCSNSFRSDDSERSAIGLLHEEMRRCNSLILSMADAHKVPAGGALAVDRDGFSAAVTNTLENHPNISFSNEEITEIPSPACGGGLGWGQAKNLWEQAESPHSPLPTSPRKQGEESEALWIIATGPLTSDALSQSILQASGGEEYLAFFDAIAPILYKESVDMSVAWFQSRYDKGDGADYINCPMNKEQYEAFVAALCSGDKTEFKQWEKNTPYFNGCLPIEVMAERGEQTLRFGPMKPVGLTNPHRPDDRPYAVVQLRQDNKLGTLYNMVGFQTKLKWGEQQRIFRTIPGLENAEFARLGGIHRNTFINSPRLLDETLRFKPAPHIRFAGQVTGVEGYVESAACGLLAGRFAAAQLAGNAELPPPNTTALGALLNHITLGAHSQTFQPMNVNFGLFPPIEGRMKKIDRPLAYTQRALRDLDAWLGSSTKQAAA